MTVETAITPELRKSRISAACAFGVHAMLLVALVTSLPSLVPILGLELRHVAYVVLALSIIAAVGSTLMTLVAKRTSSAFSIRIALGMLVVSGLFLAFTPAASESARLPLFCAAILIYGLSVGSIDATTNMQAVAIQRRYGRVILNSFHAVWSVGAIIGSLLVSAGQAIGDIAGFGPNKNAAGDVVSDPYLYPRYMWTMITVVLILAVVSLIISPKMLEYGREKDAMVDEQGNKIKFAAPMKAFAALCAAMAFFYAIDFGIQNWSPLYLEQLLDADKATAPLGVTVYTIFGLIARSLADRVVNKLGEVKTLALAAVVSIIGMIVVLTASNAIVAVVGFAIVGCGVPITAPLCFSTAGYMVPINQMDEAVGRLNLFNYAGTVFGGGIVGLIAGDNLKIAMIFPLVMAILLLLTSPSFKKPDVIVD